MLFRYVSVLKLVMIKKCENCDNLGLQIKVLPIFCLYLKDTPQICLISHQFNLYILLICGKKLVTIKLFLLNFSGLGVGGGGGGRMCDKMAISAYILKIQ